MNYVYDNQLDALFILSLLRYLYMFWASTAHHQEVRCMYVANSTSKMIVSKLTYKVIVEV
jgi:hypothetical protein